MYEPADLVDILVHHGKLSHTQFADRFVPTTRLQTAAYRHNLRKKGPG